MIVRNSLRQMRRTPLRTAVFFFLILAATAMLAVGINLWNINRESIRELEQGFTTIGTVEQRRETSSYEAVWDAQEKDYTYRAQQDYGRWVSTEELDFEGAYYIIKPERRVFFGAYMEDSVLYNVQPDYDTDYYLESTNQQITVEAVPYETGVAAPIKVKAARLLEGNENLFLGDLWVCDHYNPNPPVLEAGKRYIMCIYSSPDRHGTDNDADLAGEYQISHITCDQHTPEGEKVEGSFEELSVDEVTEGFYETERGQQWLNILDENYIAVNTIPVQPVSSLDLLLGFYTDNASVQKGREITEEEFASGEDVCLVSDLFARMNGLEVGDEIRLPLIYAAYTSPAQSYLPSGGGGAPPGRLINAQGELYDAFDEDTYKIVGIYTQKIRQDGARDALGFNEVIVPERSVEGDWSDHIVSAAPMSASNTTFQIPNGSIRSYMEKFRTLGLDQLEIRFYDDGYTDLEEGIENRRITSGVLLAGGSLMTVLVLALFGHLYISRQERRTAIERSLGLTKKGCAVSLLSGMLLLTAAGVLAGGCAGALLTEAAAGQTEAGSFHDIMFSSGALETEEEAGAEAQEMTKKSQPAAGGAAAAAAVFVLASAITGGFMRRNLKREPLALLENYDE